MQLLRFDEERADPVDELVGGLEDLGPNPVELSLRTLCDVSHDDYGSHRDLVGYGLCATCGRPTRNEVLHLTAGLCEEDWVLERGTEKVISVRRAGVRFNLALVPDAPKTAKNRRRQVRRQNNAEWKAKKARSLKARGRADRRLAQMFPEIHQMLVAEERARDGLSVFPVQTALGAQQPDDFAPVYAALTSEGITV